LLAIDRASIAIRFCRDYQQMSRETRCARLRRAQGIHSGYNGENWNEAGGLVRAIAGFSMVADRPI
jgi:hypothetical protein